MEVVKSASGLALRLVKSAALAEPTANIVGFQSFQRGVYGGELKKWPIARRKAITLRERFGTLGGPPRLLVAKLGRDGHDRGASTVASALADLGWIVAVTPLFSNADEVLRHCAGRISISWDLDIIGWPRCFDSTIVQAAKIGGWRPIPIVVCGGVISPKNSAELSGLGVARIFGPGTSVVHQFDFKRSRGGKKTASS